MYFSLHHVPFTSMEEGIYDIHCSQPPRGDQEALASLFGHLPSLHLNIKSMVLSNGQPLSPPNPGEDTSVFIVTELVLSPMFSLITGTCSVKNQVEPANNDRTWPEHKYHLKMLSFHIFLFKLYSEMTVFTSIYTFYCLCNWQSLQGEV